MRGELGGEAVSLAGEHEMFVRRGNQSEGFGELFRGTEGVAVAAREEGGDAELREMVSTAFGGSAGRMERVAEDEEAADEVGLLGEEHGGLSAAVGMAAEVDGETGFGGELSDGVGETGAVLGGARRVGRSGGFADAVGEVDAEDGPAEGGEGVGEGAQEGRVSVRAGAVGEDEGAVGVRGAYEAVHGLNFSVSFDKGGLIR